MAYHLKLDMKYPLLYQQRMCFKSVCDPLLEF